MQQAINTASLHLFLYHIKQVFPGNAGKTDTVKNSLKEFVSAKFIRIQPKAYFGWKALRVEFFGVLLTEGIFMLLFLFPPPKTKIKAQ